MKKLFLVMSIVLVCGNVFAQEEQRWKVKGFEPQVRVFFDEGIDKQVNLAFGADFIASYRFNEYVRLGGGVGLDYLYLRFQEPVTSGSKKYNAYYEGAMGIPVFANIKVDFMKTKVSPFFATDCGYSFYVPFSKMAQDNKLGFFVRPSIGVEIRFRKCSLSIDIAYKYQARSFENELASYGGSHQICQSVAVSF